HVAAEAGIAGLEFLCGVPGTIGGALRMNAGAYGDEVKDVLVWAKALDRQGRRYCLTPDRMGLSYRHCGVPESWIFTGAKLKGRPGEMPAIARRMAEIQAQRADTQPLKYTRRRAPGRAGCSSAPECWRFGPSRFVS